jgi:hypothetical protein
MDATPTSEMNARDFFQPFEKMLFQKVIVPTSPSLALPSLLASI